MKPSVYIETTIPSYLVARSSRDVVLAGHQQVTHDWWQKSRPDHELYISEYVIAEVSRGEAFMAQQRRDVLQGISLLPVNEETERLAKQLISRLGLPDHAKTDAYHIAVAAGFNARMREVSEQLKREGWTFADRPVVRSSATYTTLASEPSVVREEPPAAPAKS